MGKVSHAELQDHLLGLAYPAAKADVERFARKHGASEKIMGVISLLPEREFNSPVELSRALGAVEY